MNSNEHISSNLIHYIDTPNPQYAFLITGDWGAGKTHFIEHFIENNTPKNKRIIKISLFGLSRTSDINEKLFEQLHPVLGSKYARLAGKVVKGAVSFGIKLDLDSDNKTESSINTKLDKFNIFEFFSPTENKEELILVLDDIERSSIPLKDALGFVNELTDSQQVKVILLINESEFDKTQTELYVKFKEKVIGKTFEVSHDINEILDHFLENFGKVKQFKSEIMEIHEKSKYKNLRKLRHSLSDFEFMCEHIDDEYLENPEFFASLIKAFFALSIEAKAGAITESDLTSNKPFHKPAQLEPGVKDYHNLYFTDTPNIYSGKIWSDIIFKGKLKDLNHQTSKLLFFAEPNKKATPGWVKLWHFYELENSEFETLTTELKQQIESLKEFDLRIYLHKLSLAIYFSKHGLFEINIAKIKKLSIAYTKKYKDSEHWRSTKLSGSVFTDGLGYGYIDENDENFIKIKTEIVKQNLEAYEKGEAVRQEEASQAIASFIKTSKIEDLSKTLSETYSITPILAKMSPEQFIERLINATNTDIKAISDIMHYRYRDNIYTNNYHNFTYLKEEHQFWLNSQNILSNNISKLTGLKKHILTLFLEGAIPKFMKLLSA